MNDALLTKFQREMLDSITANVGTAGDYFLPIGCGQTTLTLLAPMHVPGCRRAVAFVPPHALEWHVQVYNSLRKSDAAVPSLSAGGKVTAIAGMPVLHLVSEIELSRPTGNDLLPKLAPDLIVLRAWQQQSARHARLVDYVTRNNEVTVVRWAIPYIRPSDLGAYEDKRRTGR